LGEIFGANLIAETPVSNGAPAGRYSVIIKFTIDENGNIIATEALTHHGYRMEQEAIRVIKKAMPNGRRLFKMVLNKSNHETGDHFCSAG
jgi:hypothetical protein